MPEYLCRKCGLIRVPESETAVTHGLRSHARCGYVVKEAAERGEEPQIVSPGMDLERLAATILDANWEGTAHQTRYRWVLAELRELAAAAHVAGRAAGLEAAARECEAAYSRCRHWEDRHLLADAAEAIRGLKGQGK